MNTKVIDAHAHCGIQEHSMPQSFEDYRLQIRGSGIDAVVMFSPVMEIYDRYHPNFEDNAEWQQRRKLSNEYVLTLGTPDLKVIPYFFIWNDFAVDQLTPQHKGIKWHRHPHEPIYHYDKSFSIVFPDLVNTGSLLHIPLARLPTICFLSDIADTFWIHAPYRILESSVKSKSEKMSL